MPAQSTTEGKVWGRFDCKRGTDHPELQTQFQQAKEICINRAQASAVYSQFEHSGWHESQVLSHREYSEGRPKMRSGWLRAVLHGRARVDVSDYPRARAALPSENRTINDQAASRLWNASMRRELKVCSAGIAALLLGMIPAAAELSRSECQALATGFKSMPQIMTGLLRSLEKANGQVVIQKTEGPALEAADAYEKARVDLLEPLRRFRDASADLSHLMRKCAG